MAERRTEAGTVTVRVTLFADLRRFLPDRGDGAPALTLPAGATVADALAATGIPAATELTAGLNGEVASPDTVLHDGDELLLFSPMSGG